MDGPKWVVYVLISTFFRYFLLAGAGYLLFYLWKKKDWYRYKIQLRFPKAAAVSTEIKYSISTMLIFSLVIWGLLFSPIKNYTLLYADIHQHSRWYFAFSILLAIFLHDTYFYWMHRLMHWKKIFRFAHHIHHKSHNPTPWAAYAFHPLEAIVEIGYLGVLVFIVPMHATAVSIFGLFMILMNVIGHLGYEFYPARFVRSKWLGWNNTSTHHNMHHRYSKCNYGLYFNIWDKLMGTNHEAYKETYDEVQRRSGEEVPVNENLRRTEPDLQFQVNGINSVPVSERETI